MAGVEQHLSLSEAFNVYVLQVPTYHLIVELLLVLLIVKLLFTKNFNPSPKKKNALTKEVKMYTSNFCGSDVNPIRALLLL